MFVGVQEVWTSGWLVLAVGVLQLGAKESETKWSAMPRFEFVFNNAGTSPSASRSPTRKGYLKRKMIRGRSACLF